MSAFANNGQESIGLEMVQTRMAVQIFQQIGAALERQAQAWNPIDKSVAHALGQPFRECKLEPPPRGSIYPGSRLGVIGLSYDRFPAVAVMSDAATLSGEELRFDQSTHAYLPQVYVEAVVRSDEFQDGDAEARFVQEGILDRRAKRYIEALAHCINVDPSLGGQVLPLPAPSVLQGDAFLLPGDKPENQTKRRVFAIVRLDYTTVSYSTRFDASAPSPGVLAQGILQ